MMGTVFKKQTTRTLPTGGVIVERKGKRLVQWKDKRNRTRTAPLTIGEDGSDRIVTESATYFAKYRDGSGIVRTIATRCRDETAARQILADLERRAELVLSNVMTAAESAVSDHQTTPLVEHVTAYVVHLDAAGCSPEHIANVKRQLLRIAAGCRFVRLADLDRQALETWLAQQTAPR